MSTAGSLVSVTWGQVDQSPGPGLRDPGTGDKQQATSNKQQAASDKQVDMKEIIGYSFKY